MPYEDDCEALMAMHAALYDAVKALRLSYVGTPDPRVHAIFEMERRAWQMMSLMRAIIPQYEEAMASSFTDAISTLIGGADSEHAAQKSEDDGRVLEMLTEAYYMMAFRIIDMGEPLGIKNLARKFNGVTKARNHLVVHPEDFDRLEWSFGYGAGHLGPVLRPAMPDDGKDHFSDPGLFANAREFLEKMTARVKAYPKGGSEDTTLG